MNKNIILFIVSFAMLMEAVDTTIINTAIPVMALSLHVNPIDLKLAMISYLLSLAIFIPISSWVADKFGIKKIFIIAILIFTLCSIWCGFSHSIIELIIARFMQGLGGSLTLPVGRLIIVRVCEKHELISKMSIVVMLAALGMMLGPVLGGFITTYFSWRWIFWVNVPVGLISIVLSYFLLPAMPARPVHALDKLGFILFGSGLATLTYSLSAFSESSIKTSSSLVAMVIAIVLLLLYVWHSYKKPNPIVNTKLLQSRTFRVAVLGNLFSRLGFGGIPFLLPLMLQLGLNYSPQLSGLLLAPTALGVFLVKPLAIFILRFLGYKRLLILNTILVGLSIWLFSTVNESSSILHIGLLTFIYGFLISLQYSGMNSLAYASLTEEDLSSATAIMSTIQQLSQSFGVAVAAIIVNLYTTNVALNHGLTLTIFHQTYFTLGLITCLSLVIFIRLKDDDGSELIEKTNPVVSA